MAHAQPQRKPARIGLLSAYGRSEAHALEGMQPFLAGMRERGYVLGEHFVLDIRLSGGDARRVPALVDELIALKPDVLLGVETSALVMAAKTSTIPIVLLTSIDPVAAGLVKSLAQPGTNVTGMSGQYAQLMAKQVELLLELAPEASRVVVLSDPFWSARESSERSAQQAATAKGLNLKFVYVKDAVEVKQAFMEFEKNRIDGLILIATGLIATHRETIREGIHRLRLPAVGPAGAGGALSYGLDLASNYHESADFVDRILKGAKPAALPVRQATRYELVVYMKNTREIGLTIPQSILLRADQVIE